MAVLFWLLIIVICIFAEIHTNAFIAVFVGAGAIVPFFLALASVPFAVEAVLWLVISAASSEPSTRGAPSLSSQRGHRPLGARQFVDDEPDRIRRRRSR